MMCSEVIYMEIILALILELPAVAWCQPVFKEV